MTSTNERLRALFLAALMVVSVFGATVAFAGSAAAIANGDLQVVSTGTDTFDIKNVPGDAYNPAVEIYVDANGDGYYNDSAELAYEAGSQSGSAESLGGALSGNESGSYTVYAYYNVTNSAGADALSDGDEFADANDSVTVHVADYANGSVDIDGERFWQGQEAIIGNLYTTGTDTTVDVMRITDRNETGGVADSELEREKPVRADGTINLDTGNLQSGDYYLEGANTWGPSSEFTVAVQDFTAELDDGEVQQADDEELTFSSKRGTWPMIISSDTLDDEELEDIFGGALTVDSSTVNDADDGEIEVTGVQADSYDISPSTDIDTGEYDIEFEVTDTGVTDDVTLTVSEAGEGQLDLAENSVDVAQGDVAAITVDLSETDTGTLLIGNEADDGYQANVSLTDDGDDQVTVYFNTYLAGMDGASADEIVWVDTQEEADEVSFDDGNETDLGSVLDAGSYEIAVKASDDYTTTQDEPDDVGTLYVQERSTDAVATWTISSTNANDIETIGELQTAVEEERLTEASTLANGDTMVAQVSASGLEGMVMTDEGDVDEDGVATTAFQNALSEYNTSSAAKNETFSLTIEQQNPGANTDPNEYDLSADNVQEVYYDGDGNYYVVVDTDNLGNFLVDSGDTEIADGDEYELSLDVKDQWLLDYTDSDWDDDGTDVYDTATSEFSIEDADASFDVEEVEDTDYVTVEAASGQTISGTTNIAPGTEVRIRAQGTDEARFVKSASEVVVQADGTFSTTFDFSDRAVDEEFEAQIRGGALPSGDDLITADGLIVEEEEEVTTTTTTEEPTTTTTEEPTTTTTEEPTTTTTEEPPTTTTTTTETPGFGIAVAMLALIGAALIALRRRD